MEQIRLGSTVTCPCCGKFNQKNSILQVADLLKFEGNGRNDFVDGASLRCCHCNNFFISCLHCGYVAVDSVKKRYDFRARHFNHKIHTDANEHVNNVGNDCADTSKCCYDTIYSGEEDDDTANGDEAMHNNDDNSNIEDDFASCFNNTVNARSYYFDEHCESESFGGMRRIVKRCMAPPNSTTPVIGSADEGTTRLYLQLLSLVYDMPASKRREQVNLIGIIYSMFRNRLKEGATFPAVPLTRLELDQQLLRNTKSMVKQIPCESLLDVDDCHGYASICGTISLEMAHGENPFGWLQDENGDRRSGGLNAFPAAQALLARLRNKIRDQGFNPDQVAIGWVSVWSDGFVTTWVKQANKGAWMFTITICFPDRCESFKSYTHVTALGPGNAIHNKVITYALKEIAGLERVTKRYCGRQKKFINTVFGLLTYAADRPERCGITHLLYGGNFGKRFMYTAHVDSGLLPSCDNCFRSRLHRILKPKQAQPIISCRHCCDWDYDDSEREAWKRGAELSKVFSGTLPNGLPKFHQYPTSSQSNIIGEHPAFRELPEQSHIRPKKITFEWLIEGVATALCNLTVGDWRRYHSDKYLATFGINEEVQGMVVDASKTAKANLNLVEKEFRSEAMKAMMTPKELFKLKAIPEIWFLATTNSNLELTSFIEVPMHHFFTGVTKDIVNLLNAILTRHNNKTKFHKRVNPLLNHLKSILRLSYCLPRTLPNKKWVSENYLAFARLIPFFFATYFNEFNTQSNINGKVKVLQRLVNAFNVLVSTLFHPKSRNNSIVDDVVKIFLSCYNDVDKAIGSDLKKSDNISLFSKQNWLALLNLHNQIQLFGDFRLHWEGRNENMITTVKKDLLKIRSKTPKSFFSTKMKKIKQRRFIDLISTQMGMKEDDSLNNIFVDEDREDDKEEDESGDDASDDEDEIEDESGDDASDDEDEIEVTNENEDEFLCPEKGKWYRGFYCYKDFNALYDSFVRKEFISCILYRGKLWCCLKSPDPALKMEICELTSIEDDQVTICGTSFFSFQLRKETDSFTNTREIERHCLLLPFLSEESNNEKDYYCPITDCWEVLTPNHYDGRMIVTVPKLDPELFDMVDDLWDNDDDHNNNKRIKTS